MFEVTEQQKKQWKAKHKDVFLVQVPLDDEGSIAEAYMKKPSLDAISAAAKFEVSDPVKSSMIIFESCWIDGEAIIKESTEAKLSALKAVKKIFKVRVATIKKI